MVLEVRLERLKLLRDWRVWATKIAAEFRRIMSDAEVYVFGSVVEGSAHGGSDVDILVVSEQTPKRLGERSKIIADVESKLNLPLHHPFEIHLVNPGEAEFYKKHIRRLENVTRA